MSELYKPHEEEAIRMMLKGLNGRNDAFYNQVIVRLIGEFQRIYPQQLELILRSVNSPIFLIAEPVDIIDYPDSIAFLPQTGLKAYDYFIRPINGVEKTRVEKYLGRVYRTNYLANLKLLESETGILGAKPGSLTAIKLSSRLN